MTAFYNEIDPYAAQWLRNLIAAGHIAPGVVDERPIQEIDAWELARYTQCHFFAGIGIWSLALRRAGWSDDLPIWTGSCPCQPFSAAGQRKGISDERHLWPTWFNLIEQCKPPIVVGEQVASKDGLGWLDLVSTDMERANYAVGASDLCAAGFGEAHLRQRLYFIGMAHTIIGGQSRQSGCGDIQKQRVTKCGAVSGLADANGGQRARITNSIERFGVGEAIGRKQSNGSASNDCSIDRMGNTGCTGTGWFAGSTFGEEAESKVSGRADGDGSGNACGSASAIDGTIQRSAIRDPGEIDQRWLDADWLLCRNPAGEPSWRPVEPGTFPLAHGVAARMVKLRAYGNALDAETATSFAKVVKEICERV